jgi:hypothetical protein
MGPRAGLDGVEYRKVSYSFWESNPGRPTRSPSLQYAIGLVNYAGCLLALAENN